MIGKFFSDNPDYYITYDNGEAALAQYPKPEFKTMSFSLSGKIGVNFYMELPTFNGIDYSGSNMEFSIPHGTCTSSAEYDASAQNNKGYYRFTCYINFIQMAKPIKATFHYKLNNEEKFVANTFVVNDYFTGFDTAVEEGTVNDPETIALVKALADYCHYVQPFLAKYRNWTLGVDYAAMEKYYTEKNEFNIEEIKNSLSGHGFNPSNQTDGDIVDITQSLTLDSDTMINVYFKPAKGYNGTFTASVDNGEAKTYKKGSDERYCVQIDGISAHKLSDIHTIKVTTSKGTASVNVSALSYVKLALDYYTDDMDAIYAVASIYAYSQAANAYMTAHSND